MRKTTCTTTLPRKQFTTEITCDLCRLALHDWSITLDPEDVKIQAEWTANGKSTRIDCDCCITCFVRQVKPALEALGLTMREYDPSAYPSKGDY